MYRTGRLSARTRAFLAVESTRLEGEPHGEPQRGQPADGASLAPASGGTSGTAAAARIARHAARPT